MTTFAKYRLGWQSHRVRLSCKELHDEGRVFVTLFRQDVELSITSSTLTWWYMGPLVVRRVGPWWLETMERGGVLLSLNIVVIWSSAHSPLQYNGVHDFRKVISNHVKECHKYSQKTSFWFWLHYRVISSPVSKQENHRGLFRYFRLLGTKAAKPSWIHTWVTTCMCPATAIPRKSMGYVAQIWQSQSRWFDFS